MGKCVSKHPSAITIASAEYLTSNNKIFIENYTDSITIKNENTNSDNSIYINSEYIPIPTTETDILTVNPATTTATTVQTKRNYKKYSKNDKNLSNNTIVIEDYKNKKTKCQKEQQKIYQNNNNKNSKNDGNKSKKRKFSTKNEKSEIVVTNRNIVKNLTSQISKFTHTNSCINPTIEPTATEINCYSKDNIIDFQNKENIHVDNDSSILQQSTIIKPDFDKIKNFDNQKLSEKEQINNNDNTTLKIHSNGNNNNNNNNNTIEILKSCNSNNSHDDKNDDDNNQHDNENHDTKAIAGISFCNNNYFNKKLKKLPLTKENSKNQNKCNTKNCSNYYYNSINNSTNSIGNRNGNHNTNGNGILFSAKKISCLSKNESQDSLDTDEILKSLNTKKSHSNKIDENKNDNNQNENDKENILIQNDEEEELKEVARQDEEVIKENNFSLHNEGQTESKKKSKNIGPDTKGTAMSFGFRKKLNNTPKKQKFLKDKHNIKDNCNNSDNVATDGTIITNPVLKDDLNNFHDKNGNSDTIDATTNITATQQKFNSTTIMNTFDKNETTWATHRTATQLSQNKEHISLMGGGNVNGSGGGSGGGNNFGNNRNRFGFRSANIIRPASTGIPAPSIMTELQDNTNNNNNNNNNSSNNTVTVKRRSKSASGVSSSRENSYSSDNEKNNRNNNGGVGGIGNVAGGNIITKRSTLVNRNNDQQQQQQKVVNEVRFAENPKINYITSVHDIDDEYNSRPHWKQQNDIRRSGGMTSEMLRNQFFNSGCNAPMSSGMMNRHGNMMNQNQIITTGMHTNVIVKPKPIMTTTTVTACKYTLHTASLPKPQYPVPISLTTTAPSSSSSMDIKSAKQMVNNNRKGVFGPRDISTDSGLSSMDNTIDSSNASRSSVLRSISSTKASASGTSSNGGSPKKLSKNRPRNLEMVISGRHKFEVRDLDALSSCDNVEPLALPKLPSVFSSENQQLAPLSGLVRSNTILSRDSASTTQESTPEDMRKTSRTNSESDSINEEKLFRDRSTAEKDTNKKKFSFLELHNRINLK